MDNIYQLKYTGDKVEEAINNALHMPNAIEEAVSSLVGSAPEVLNTLNELSKALGDDPNFATTIASEISNCEKTSNKVDEINEDNKKSNTQYASIVAITRYLADYYTITETERRINETLHIHNNKAFLDKFIELNLEITSNKPNWDILDIITPGIYRIAAIPQYIWEFAVENALTNSDFRSDMAAGSGAISTPDNIDVYVVVGGVNNTADDYTSTQYFICTDGTSYIRKITRSVSQGIPIFPETEAKEIISYSYSGFKNLGNIVDQIYNPDSENSQSGKAVAEAIADALSNIITPDNALSVNSGVRLVEDVKFKVNTTDITEDTSFTADEGWSGTLSDGFTFSGRLETSKLIFNVNLDPDSLYLIRFKMSQYKEGKVFVGIGNGYDYDVYMGGSQAIAILESDGGQPYIEVRSDNATFEATFTELSCCKITDDGVEEFEIHPDSIYRGVDKPTIGTWNVTIGDETTMGNNINGTRNIGIGAYAFRNFKTGTRNIGIGTYSLSGLKKGDRNTGIGADALFAAEEAQDNVVIGKSALTGKHPEGAEVARNVCIGNGTLTEAKDGVIENTIIGHNAGKYARDKNVHIGHKSGYFSKGNNNVSIGNDSFTKTQPHEGDNNTVIGAEAQKSNDSLNGIVAIGYKVLATKDNQCVLGGDNITETLLKGELFVQDAEGNIHKVYKEEDVMNYVKNYVSERETLYSNSLKGNANGEAVTIEDVSPIIHKLKISIDNADEDTKLFKTSEVIMNELSWFPASSSNSVISDINNAVYLPKGKYTLAVKELQNCTTWRLYIKVWDKDQNMIVNETGATAYNALTRGLKMIKADGSKIGYSFKYNTDKTKEYIMPDSSSDALENAQVLIELDDDYYMAMGVYNGDTTKSTICEDPRLVSEYMEYTPNEDGTVDNVTSVYPITNLYTNTANAIVEVEYNRDINKVIKMLQQVVLSLGGNV